MSSLTKKTLKQLWPHAPEVLLDAVVATSPAVFSKYGLDTVTSQAHALAQFSHESGGGTIREESLNYTRSKNFCFKNVKICKTYLAISFIIGSI